MKLPAGQHVPLAADGNVSTLVAGGVADICFGHPKSNSLPGTVLRDLAAAIAGASSRDDVRAIVVRSYGTGAFCAGASFDELASIRDAAQGKAFFMGFARVIGTMIQSPKPIVVRVHGKTVGGGVGIVAAGDYSVATSSASVRLSELAVGIGPFVVGPAIERRIGAGAFGAMAIDADWRDAAWAERHGLYARVVDDLSALDAEVDRRVSALAAANPEAVAGIKRAVWSGTDDWPALLEERAATSGTLVLSEFTRKAIAKFGQK
jgi:methylglutaconyl-CoA hydratase